MAKTKAEKWLTGVKANLARKAGGGDRDVARDIMGGICEIGIANSYYVGLMRSGKGGPEQQEWGKAIKVVLPTFKDGGTQVNVSGAAIAKNAPNKADAVKLLEYLVSDEAQKIYAEANYEHPVNANAAVDPLIAELGTLKPDQRRADEGGRLPQDGQRTGRKSRLRQLDPSDGVGQDAAAFNEAAVSTFAR